MRERTENISPDRADQNAFEAILNCPASSYWLKDLITSGSRRDPVDVIHDLRAALNAFESDFDAKFTRPEIASDIYDPPFFVPVSIIIFIAALISILAAINHDRYEPNLGYFAATSFVFMLLSLGWAFHHYRRNRA